MPRSLSRSTKSRTKAKNNIRTIARPVTSRALSTHCAEALEKLKGALDQYRMQNYSQCLPSRFKKDLIRAATSDDGKLVALEGMQRVLSNIKMDHKVTRADMETIFKEIGGSTEVILADRLLKII